MTLFHFCLRPEQVFKLLAGLGRSLYCLLAILFLGTHVVPLLHQGCAMVVSWWYQCRTRVVPVRYSCYLIYSCLVPVLYLCGTYWNLGGTCVVPMWYMFNTCPCRPEQVNKLLHDLGRSLYIACWQYYLLVPGWYHFCISAVPGWYPCCSCLVQVLHQYGTSVLPFLYLCWQTWAGL